MKGRIRNWIGEHRRTTAFLREHWDEYKQEVKTWAVLYGVLICALAVLVVALPYDLSRIPYGTAWYIHLLLSIGGLTALAGAIYISIDGALEVQAKLKKKYHYNTNH